MKHLPVQFVLLLTIALVGSTAWATIPNAIVATEAVQAGPAFNLSAAAEPTGKHTGNATRVAPVYLASGDEPLYNNGYTRTGNIYNNGKSMSNVTSTVNNNKGHTRTGNIYNSAKSMSNVTSTVNKDKGHTRTGNIVNNAGSMTNVTNTVNNNIIHIH